MHTPQRLVIALSLSALTFVNAGAAAADQPLGHGNGGLAGGASQATTHKPGLRKEVARLRAEVAQLATQVNYINRNASDAPATGGGMVPGVGPGGICGDPCAVDSDDDGIGDCEDYCACDPNIADTDGDGLPDCADPCPDDAANECMNPCNFDSDNDGIGDCEDPCPWDPAVAVDTDNDGTYDCSDPCPTDPKNECFGPCVLDQDGDGAPDCKDPCPWAPVAPDGSTTVCMPPPVMNAR